MWLVLGNTTRHRHVSKLRFADRFFRPCSFSCTRLEYCFAATNNRDVESLFALTRAGHNHNAWPHQRARHETNPFSQGHCSVKPSRFHPNAEAVTVLTHIFDEIEGLTNTRQRTHRKPPLSFHHSVTRPSHMFDKFEVTVSLAQCRFAFAHDGGTHTAKASRAR